MNGCKFKLIFEDIYVTWESLTLFWWVKTDSRQTWRQKYSSPYTIKSFHSYWKSQISNYNLLQQNRNVSILTPRHFNYVKIKWLFWDIHEAAGSADASLFHFTF